MKLRELPQEMKYELTDSAEEKFNNSIHYSEYDTKGIYPLAFEFGYEDAWDSYSEDIRQMTDKGRDLIADYAKGLFDRNIIKWEKDKPMKVCDAFVNGYVNGFQTSWNYFMQEAGEDIIDYNEKDLDLDDKLEEKLTRMWRLLRISHQ